MRRLIVVLIVCFLFVNGLSSCSSSVQEPKEQDIKAICELATVKCFYNNVAKITKDASNILQKDREIWIEYEGEAAVGIEMSDVTITISGEEVAISLPKAQVLSYSIVKDSFRYVSSADGWLFKNKITVEDEQKAVEKAQSEMKDSVSNNKAAFALAEKRAKELIENYIKKIGEFSDVEYRIVWK